jgi:hypothetical protein
VAKQRRQHVAPGAVDHGAVADGLGAEVVLADGLQHPAEGRVDDAQQRQEQQRHGHEQQVVGEDLAVDGQAQQGLSKGSKDGLSHSGS